MEPSLRAKRSNPEVVGRYTISGLLRRCAPRNDGTRQAPAMRKLCPTRAGVQDHLARGALALWRDTDGLMVPYVAVMLPVLVGFALLALDGSRRMSLQTQMQAAADSLALAGARELNKQTVAESGLHVRFLFQPVRGERGNRRRCGERRFGREIRRGEDHSADLVHRASGVVPQEYFDQRVR